MRAGDIFSRFGSNTKSSTLEIDLKKVTESGVIEVPEELLAAVTLAAQSEEDRREIMRHLRSCLAEPTGKRWRRVWAGLVLTEHLVKKGPPELLVETAQGHHFDLVQRLSLLENFEYTTDKRIQNSVRAKAKGLRAELVPRLQDAELEAPWADDKNYEAKDTASTCSPGITTESTCSTVMTGFGFDSMTPISRPRGPVIVDGIVRVGTNDDTDSGSSGDECPKAALRQMARPKFQDQRAAGGSGSEDESRSRPPSHSAAPPAHILAAASVDLLEL